MEVRYLKRSLQYWSYTAFTKFYEELISNGHFNVRLESTFPKHSNKKWACHMEVFYHLHYLVSK